MAGQIHERRQDESEMYGKRRSKLAMAMALALALATARSLPARAQLFTGKQTEWLVARLAAPDSRRPAAPIAGAYGGVLQLREHIDLSRYAVPPYEVVACVLDRAAEESASVAQLFADDVFLTDGPLAIALGPDTLRRVDADFNLHGLFPLAVNASDGRPLRMVFFVVGRGRLFIGYDRDAQASPPEAAYHIFSGKFEFRQLIRMTLARDSDGAKTLSQIATLSSPTGDFGPFLGPANSSISRIKLSGSKAVVSAKLAFTITRTLDLPSIERRRGRAAAPAGSSSSTCPLLRALRSPPTRTGG